MWFVEDGTGQGGEGGRAGAGPGGMEAAGRGPYGYGGRLHISYIYTGGGAVRVRQVYSYTQVTG